MIASALQQSASLLWGILVPALIFVIAFVVTLLLYRHFSREV